MNRPFSSYGNTVASHLFNLNLSKMRNLVVLALLLCVTQTAAQSNTSCLDDVVACAPLIRERFLDIDYYFFGTPYADQCPGSPYCMLPRPDLQSIMARIMVTNDSATLQSAVTNIQFLNVTFERPAQSYFACDTTNSLPASAPKTLNPLEPANLPQIYVAPQPTVTWTPRNDQILYTFFMYDASFVFLHSYFINCPGGSLDGCEVVRPWLGSGAGITINSAYTYLVYEQTARIPIAIAQQATEDTAAEQPVDPISPFFLPSLFQKLSSYYSNNPTIQFASIMEMFPDPFGSSRLSRFFSFLDQCPLFYSQLPEFHTVVRALEIPNPVWSTPAFGISQVAINPNLLTLTVHMHVTYESDDFTETACCKQYQITRGTHMVSPLDSRPVRASLTRQKPLVLLDPLFLQTGGGGRSSIAAVPYTLLAVDVTPVLTSNVTGPNLTVHWLVTNIFESDFFTGTHLVPYSPPSPTDADTPVTLMFLLFTHSTPVDPRTLNQLCPNGPTMCELRVADLISTMGLGDIVGLNWLQVEEDGFSIKRQYTDLGMSERDVCTGRDGYDTPCPNQQPCSAIGQIGFSHPFLIGQLAAMVLLLTYFRT